MTRQNETITLLPAESLLRTLLLDCREEMAKSQAAASSDGVTDTSASELEIWFTGGWVRDRLLGIPCHDIDIALSTMTGQKFGDYLADFFKRNEAKYQRLAADLGVGDTHMSGLHTTKQNLRKSKQLETTMGKVFGLDLDIVNLRKEVYEEDSRTPEMAFGTAEEDALRRDATVNALFFHLDSQRIVDHTARGLDDMAAGIIRTPLEPRKTFMDDPLRVLRLVRIGSKLGYAVDPETRKWMADPEIHAALVAKVSRERVGIELFKAMKQRTPQVAFHLLFETNLYSAVFLQLDTPLHQALLDLLPAQEPSQPWPATWPRAYHLLATLARQSPDSSSLARLVQSEEVVELPWIMAAYAPVAGLRHKKLTETVSTATESIKATVKITKLLDTALRNVDPIRKMIALADDSRPPRSVVGMAIRSWGATWKLQVLYSLLADVVYDESTAPLSSFLSTDENFALRELLRQYDAFLDLVAEQKVEDAHMSRPMLDGNTIMQLFGVKKGGAFLRTAMEELVAWQLDHEGAGTDEAKSWLLQQRERLGVPEATA
ncbi:hypothetical protein HIM_09591 [Hirsutella minnesotensis 3608]|uniref:Poly A polymerase head domain-containing protein n=1 Tax=Hirsutella minnesotensis 3608 TaxID=1043627 RepID=A0A0F7ZXN1_9HYPO|nr:hypothetical protein HIM_09591 [Hirsutella minnesotensis 3608]